MTAGAKWLGAGVLVAVLAACAVPAVGQPFPAAKGKAVFFGDSVTVGVGASADRYRYANLIARANGWALSNQARSGTQLADEIPAIYSEAVEPAGNYLILTGYNDMRNFGLDNNGLVQYRGALYAALAWLSIPDGEKIKASGGRVAYEGAWNASPAPGGFGRSSSQQGARAVFTVSGSVIYIGGTGMPNGTGTFSVTVDGDPKGVYSCSVPRAPASGFPFAPFLVRLTGLSAGPHQVEIAVASAAGNVYFDWAAGSRGAQGAGPKVFVGNALRMQREAYRFDAPYWNAGSDEAVSAINTIIRDACRELAGDGRNVVHVDASAAFDPDSADVGPDRIHPSDRGMEKIAAAFLDRMR
jgi:lysophospholipase L1-like esterase